MTAARALDYAVADRERVTVYEWQQVVRRLRLGRRQTGLRVTALTLATFASPDGSHVYPSVDTLAAASEQSRRTTLRHLAALRETYMLIGLVSRGGGRGRAGLASHYVLTLPIDLLERFVLLDPDLRPIGVPRIGVPPTEAPPTEPSSRRRDHLRIVHSA